MGGVEACLVLLTQKKLRLDVISPESFIVEICVCAGVLANTHANHGTSQLVVRWHSSQLSVESICTGLLPRAMVLL